MKTTESAGKKGQRQRRRPLAQAPAVIEPGRLYSDEEWGLFTAKDRRTWAAVRARGEIAYLKIGRSVRYRGEDLLAYLEKSRVS